MTREHILIFLGVLVLLSPWSGLPMAWLEWALLLIGLAIIGIAYSRIRKDRRVMPPPHAPLPPPSSEEPRPRSSNIAFS